MLKDDEVLEMYRSLTRGIQRIPILKSVIRESKKNPFILYNIEIEVVKLPLPDPEVEILSKGRSGPKSSKNSSKKSSSIASQKSTSERQR